MESFCKSLKNDLRHFPSWGYGGKFQKSLGTFLSNFFFCWGVRGVVLPKNPRGNKGFEVYFEVLGNILGR